MRFSPIPAFSRSKASSGPKRGPRRRRQNARLRAETLESRRLLAAFLVNTVDDVVAADGFVSLREAVMAANTDAAVGDAAAGEGGDIVDTIEFSPDLAGGNFVLDGQSLAVQGALEIDGGDVGITIDADARSRVISIDNGNLRLTNLTLTNGRDVDGGGLMIGDDASAVLFDVDVTNNIASGDGVDVPGSGGGIFNAGDLVHRGGSITGNVAVRAGGGIEATAGSTTMLDGIDLSSNQAGDSDLGASPGNGGGLHVTGAGDVQIESSTIDGNTAAAEGGGLWNGAGEMIITDTVISLNTASGDDADQGGGGIYNLSGTLRIFDSTVRDNTADGAAGSGGGILNEGTLRIDAGTIGANVANRAGGGIEATEESFTVLRGVILADNIAGPTGTAAPGNGGGLHITGDGDAAINETIVRGNFAAAEGGGLWNGSGQMTIIDSTIVNNIADGDDADQGGGGIYNLAGELNIFRGTITENVALGTAGSGGGILNEGTLQVENGIIANNMANRAGGGIESTAGSTTNISASLMSNNVAGPIETAMPGNGGALHISGDADANIDNTTLEFNSAASEGGALWNGAGQMFVTDSIIVGNQALGNDADNGGGGIFNNGGSVDVSGTLIDGNIASGVAGSGGGVLNQGTFNLSDSTIGHNVANRAGGGIEATAGSSTSLENVTVLENSVGAAPGNGGGLHITGDGDATIMSSTIASNFAAAEGGGLWNGAGEMLVVDSLIVDNVAGGDDADQGGGGIYNRSGTLTVTGSKLSDNLAVGISGSGGGILNSGTALLADVIFDSNQANRAGGAIEVTEDSVTTIADSILRHNIAGDGSSANPGNGGALHISSTGDVQIQRSSVESNRAANEGGGLWNSPVGTLMVDSSSIVDNASPEGGGVYVDMSSDFENTTSASGPGETTFLNSTISGNQAVATGGGISATGFAGNRLTLDSVTLVNNVSSAGTAGLDAVLSSGISDATITNSVIANNVLLSDSDQAADVAGVLAAQAADSIFGSSGLELQISPLVRVGDSFLRVHLPLDGSPLIDAGDTTLAVDQLGNARVAADGIDIGAIQTLLTGDDGGGDGGGPVDVQSRILTRSIVSGYYSIPGDGRPTAIVFGANAPTVVSVGSIGSASVISGIQILDRDLNPIQTRVAGTPSATLESGGMYAIIFPATDTARQYVLQSSEGESALRSAVGHNMFQPTDTNGDGESEPIDALRVINGLRQSGGTLAASSLAEGELLDVDGNGIVQPLDALMVINQLRQNAASQTQSFPVQSGAAEAERLDTIIEAIEMEQGVNDEIASVSNEQADDVADFAVRETTATPRPELQIQDFASAADAAIEELTGIGG